MAAERHDTIVVGAGILGLAVAREILARRPAERVLVLEREAAPAAHQSSHNSGVIHAGIYYAPGSLKARLCVEGAARLYAYCAANAIDVRRIGKLVIALRPDELPALDELGRRARANGVADARRVDGDGLRAIEPHAAGIAALHSPGTAIVDFGAVCRQLAADVVAAGGELRCGWEVRGATATARAIRLRSAAGDEAQAARAVFCAGLWSDRLAVLAGADGDPRIVPFRGAYRQLRPERSALVRGLIYPVPDARLPFLGVHLTPRLDGTVLIGPTALLVGARDGYRLGALRAADVRATATWPGTWRMLRRWWRTGLTEAHLAASPAAFAAAAARYVPGIQAGDLRPAFAGVRAQAVGRDGRLIDDFALSCTPRAIHVRNAPSPAATSALALAALIADRADQLG
ncbi:MAG: (S)-2-hydroxyglutarate dehydrogenase [Solirubrobacteraceae bacterium]|nr:(S)-2-hydroxyglutarate dehydrogenase [Solirubrobacteraceae bacterium]